MDRRMYRHMKKVTVASVADIGTCIALKGASDYFGDAAKGFSDINVLGVELEYWTYLSLIVPLSIYITKHMGDWFSHLYALQGKVPEKVGPEETKSVPPNTGMPVDWQVEKDDGVVKVVRPVILQQARNPSYQAGSA